MQIAWITRSLIAFNGLDMRTRHLRESVRVDGDAKVMSEYG